jgi:hypothetical protein
VKKGSKIRLRMASGIPPPVIADADDRESVFDARLHGDQAFLRQALRLVLVRDRMRGVHHEVQHHLVDLPAMTGHERQIGKFRFEFRDVLVFRCAR